MIVVGNAFVAGNGSYILWPSVVLTLGYDSDQVKE